MVTRETDRSEPEITLPPPDLDLMDDVLEPAHPEQPVRIRAAEPVPEPRLDPIRSILEEVRVELARARVKFGPMASGHEAQSVIGEEFHEFTLAVWFGVDQRGQPADPRAEAVQLAAMAVRYILDVAALTPSPEEERP